MTHDKTQTEVFEQLQDITRRWQDRIQVEAKMTSELASGLAAARSVPDVLAAYQEWGKQRLQLMSEDAVGWYDNAHRFIHLSPQLLLNGWRQDGLSS
jgi:hypothetical protein